MKKLYLRINAFWLKCRKWSNESVLGYITGGIVKLILIVVFVVLFYFISEAISPSDEGSLLSDSNTEQEDCNVVGISLHGTIGTYIPNHTEDNIELDDATASEDVEWYIDNANEDENIRAILVEVDSHGGSPVAGEEIAKAIKNSHKPVFAFIRDIGASSAYWAISSADKIWASKNSNIGSIGVTMSYLNEVEYNKEKGYSYVSLSAGKFKDSLSVDKPLTQEERDLFMRDINIMYNNFISDVSNNRSIPIEKIREIADGSTVLGEKAKELGLVDEIGGMIEVKKFIEDTIREKPEICWQ